MEAGCSVTTRGEGQQWAYSVEKLEDFIVQVVLKS